MAKKAEGESKTETARRSTRSKGVPSPLKREGTMDKTAAEAEAFLSREGKKRGRAASRSTSPKKTTKKRAASSSPKKKASPQKKTQKTRNHGNNCK